MPKQPPFQVTITSHIPQDNVTRSTRLEADTLTKLEAKITTELQELHKLTNPKSEK